MWKVHTFEAADTTYVNFFYWRLNGIINSYMLKKMENKKASN